MLFLLAFGFFIAGVAATAATLNERMTWGEWTVIFCVNRFLGWALANYKESR
jgi:hypothetical protein